MSPPFTDDGPHLPRPSVLDVERVDTLAEDDMLALCEAADAAILDGGGFGWISPPGRMVLSGYFSGVMMVPERILFVGRLDGTIVSSAQLALPARFNEAQSFAATLLASFTAPYARGHGLGKMLTRRMEDCARSLGHTVITLDVRETQLAAIRLYEQLGYERWGVNSTYARVHGQMIRGFHYSKSLRAQGHPQGGHR